MLRACIDRAAGHVRLANQAIGPQVCLVGSEGEDRSNLQVVLAFLALSPEGLVNLGQSIDRTDTHDGPEFPIVGLSVMLLDDPVNDAIYAPLVLEEPLHVDAMNLFVEGGLFCTLAWAPPVFHREAQDILVPDCVGNHVFMESLLEKVLCGALSDGIFLQDRRSGEAEELGAGEVADDVLVGVAELAAMTFIENKNHAPAQDVLEA